MKSLFSFISRLIDEPDNDPPSTSGSDIPKGGTSVAAAASNVAEAIDAPCPKGTDRVESTTGTPTVNTTGEDDEESLQLSPHKNLDFDLLTSGKEQLSPTKELGFEMLTLDESDLPPERGDAKNEMPAKSQLFNSGEYPPSNKNPPQPGSPLTTKSQQIENQSPLMNVSSGKTPVIKSELEKENLRSKVNPPEPKRNQNPPSNDNSRLQTGNPPVMKPANKEKQDQPCFVEGARFVEQAEEVFERRPSPKGKLFNDFIKESFPAPAKPPVPVEMFEVEDLDINPYLAAQQLRHTHQKPTQSRVQTKGHMTKKSNQTRQLVEVEDSEINPYPAQQSFDARQVPEQSRNQWRNKQKKKNKGGNQNRPEEVPNWFINPNLAQTSHGQQNKPKSQNWGKPPQQNMQRPPNMMLPWNVPPSGVASNSSWTPVSQKTNTESQNRGSKWQKNQGSSYNAAARPGGSTYRRGPPRDLYKASCMQELENNSKRFETDFSRKHQDLFRLSRTLVQYGDENFENGDEERAYLEYMKYIRMCMQALDHPNIEIDTSHMSRCMANTEKLSDSLKQRYEIAQMKRGQSVATNNFQQTPILPPTIPALPSVPQATTPSPSSENLNPQLILAQLLTSQLLPPTAAAATQAAPTPQQIAAQLLTNQSGGNPLLLALAASLAAQNNPTSSSHQPGTSSTNVPGALLPTPLIPVAVPTVTPFEVTRASSTSAQIKPAITKKGDQKGKAPRRQQVDVSDQESEESSEEEDEEEVPGTEGGPWKRAKGGEVPVGAVEGGKNHLGPIYVARMQHVGKQVPGKLIPSYGSCYITWKTKEVKSKDYEVLCDNNVGWMKVIDGSPSTIPRNAIFGGVDEKGEPLYIGRAKHTTSITVGKVEGNSMKCLVLYGSAEHEFKDFELLVSVSSRGGGQQGSSRSGYSRPSRGSDDSSNSRTSKSRGRGQSQSKNTSKSGEGSWFPWGKKRSGGDEQQEIVKASFRTEPFTKHIPAMKLLDGGKDGTQENFKLTTLAASDADYIFVSQKMQGSIATHPGVVLSQYTIAKIEKVWNTKLWSMYTHSIKKIKAENSGKVNERRLFHGSGKCLDIVERGFDERHAAMGMFGAGVYFADHSSKSHQYAKSTPRMMMLCRVALGKVMEHTTANPSYSHAPPGYHSVKGVPGGSLNYAEYIVYRGEQALPEFLITYS